MTLHETDNTHLTAAGITKTTTHDLGENKHDAYPYVTWQHIYKSPKGIISVVYLAIGYKSPWEICSIGENDLFEDVEGYRSLKAAEDRIMELLA